MKKQSPDDHDEEGVGYKKPPKHSRFKPGQSGNPAGRPKKMKGLRELLDEALQEMIRTDGKSLPLQQVLVQSLIRNAIKGKPAAMNIVFGHLGTHDPQVGEEDFDPEVDDKIALQRWLAQINAKQKEGKDD